MAQLRVLITDNDLGDSVLETRVLEEGMGDVQIDVGTCRTEEDVLAAVERSRPHAIIVQWAPITRAVLTAAPDCKIVSRIGIGVDMIDQAAADELGVSVRNVTHYCTEEVATHAVAMGLSLWRDLPQFDRLVRNGMWDAASHASTISRLSDAVVGLIGMGRIGRLVADAYAHWGARVIVSDPVSGDDPYERVGLDAIAAEAELISLHAPLVEETHHIVGEQLLATVRRTPIVVNVSRGGLVDIDALADALDDSRVRGAGLDVFEQEPLTPEARIVASPNTILTPHAAWCSSAALPELRRQAAQNVVEALHQLQGARP